MIYNIPIESLPERYSEQWNEWIPPALEAAGAQVTQVYPQLTDMPTVIRHGAFLDVVHTHRFKFAQLQMLLREIALGRLHNNDVLFFHDLWYPGLESLFYVRDALKLNFRICGMLHAGTYDDNDFLTKHGMREWGEPLERAWFNSLDAIFLATKYHAGILKPRLRPTSKVDCVVLGGFPMYLESVCKKYMRPMRDRENVVVFPHRLDDEKDPRTFAALEEALRARLVGWKFVRSKDVCKTKDEFYALLGRSKIAVSCALQETWGIAQQEATLLGCVPLVPDRLSYCEMYDKAFRYRDFQELCEATVSYANTYDDHGDLIAAQASAFVARNEAVVRNMVGYMEARGWNIV